MKKIVFITACLLFAGCAGEKVVENEKTVRGMIKVHGIGSFIADVDGNELRFNIGRSTKYNPSEFRGMEGDEVEIKYYPRTGKGKTVNAVTLLKRVKAGPNQPDIESPATGRITKAPGKFRVNTRYTIEINGKSYTFKPKRDGYKQLPTKWTPKIDDKVRVSFEIIPGRSNFYIYTMHKLERLD